MNLTWLTADCWGALSLGSFSVNICAKDTIFLLISNCSGQCILSFISVCSLKNTFWLKYVFRITGTFSLWRISFCLKETNKKTFWIHYYSEPCHNLSYFNNFLCCTVFFFCDVCLFLVLLSHIDGSDLLCLAETPSNVLSGSVCVTTASSGAKSVQMLQAT